MLDARYRGLVQSTLFDKVKMAVVLFSIDIQPFIFFSQVDTQMVKEGNSEVVAWFAWTGRVESKSRPDVPKPVIAIVGCLREDYEVVYEHGIDAVFPIIRQLGDLSEILC